MQAGTGQHQHQGSDAGSQHQRGIGQQPGQSGDYHAGAQGNETTHYTAYGKHGAVFLGGENVVGQLVFADGPQGDAHRLQQADAGEHTERQQGRGFPDAKGDVQ